MIRIRLINEGRVVKQITSRLHEGVVLEQVKNYKDPFDTIQIVEGELSEGAKDMLHHVARKIIPAAMAAGVAMGGAGAANAQTGGYNPNYPGLNHSVGQHMADIFSPNYKEAMRQREYQRSTERQVWNAEQNEIRKQRVADARARAGGGQSAGPKMYDQSRVSQDGKYYIIYGLDNTVKRIPVAGTEYMPGDSQRLPHYIASNGGVYYVRHPHMNESVNEGYTVTRGIDKERYQERPGLEGPFSTKSGKVVYYDKVEGKYYDPDTDMYIGHEDYAKMDEAAPIAATLAGGLGLGVVAAAGAPAIVGILGPLLGIPLAAYGAYSAAKLGMKGVEKLWDMAAEKLGGDDKVTQYTNAKLAKLPPEEAKAAAAVVKQIGESKQSAVAEDATVGTIPANGTVGTSGGTGRTQFAPTGKTTNAKFNNKGQIELDTEQEDDGSVNLDADAVKQLQQAGVQIKEDEHSPVAGAITRRILLQRHDLLSKYGPVLVMQAIDEVADYVGDVEEIGSSDVSGWIKQVEQMLANNPPEAFSESGENRYRFIRHNIWTAMDSDEEVLQHTVEGDPFYSAKKFMRDLDDQGYDFTHVISPEGKITYSPEHDPRHLENFPTEESVTEGTDVVDVVKDFAKKWMKKFPGDPVATAEQNDAAYEKYADIFVKNLLQKRGVEITPKTLEKTRSDFDYYMKQEFELYSNNQGITEGTDSLEGILSKFSTDYAKFKAGGDIDENEDFFQALFDYYSENGEMPYGVQKARDGDPYAWITDRLDQESGVDPVVEAESDEATPGDQAAADQNIIMQIRKASDYEKPTRIELADGTESVIAPNIAKQLLAKFDKMKPESKALLQDTLNTEEGFKEILAYFGGGVREQAAVRASNIMQSAMVEAGFGRDAYQRDYDSSVSGMDRGADHRGLKQELAHEDNDWYRVVIAKNGKWEETKAQPRGPGMNAAMAMINSLHAKYPTMHLGMKWPNGKVDNYGKKA